MKRFILALLITGAMVGVASCRGFENKPPAGFAAYDDSTVMGQGELRAITADGVRYRLRQVANEPEGDTSIWTEAVRRNLEKKGYRVVEVKNLRTADGHDLRVLRSAANLAGKDYSYIVAFCPIGNRILLVEVAGTTEALQPRDKDVEAALRSLKLP